MSSGYTSSSETITVIHQILCRAAGSSDLEVPVLLPVEGGSINATYSVLTKDHRQWFSKINDSTHLPDLFEKEKKGLELLREQGACRIPAVVAFETAGSRQVLILEWIVQGQPTDG